MDSELAAVAQRAVACPAWRWVPGMQALWDPWSPIRVLSFLSNTLVGMVEERRGTFCYREIFNFAADKCQPDLDDPATQGCLLALVREAWRDEYLSVVPVDYGTGGPGGVWWVCRLGADGRELHRTTCKTAVEALVIALENAPNPKA